MPTGNGKCKPEEHCEAAKRLMTLAELEELSEMVAEKVARKIANRPKYLSREEMAGDLGVAVSTIDKMVARGTIPAIKIDGRRVVFDPAQVSNALNKQPGAA